MRGLRRVERKAQQILNSELTTDIVAIDELQLRELLENLAWTTISTKFAHSWGRHLATLAASSVMGLSDLYSEQLKVMRLPGGSVEDSVSVAGVVVRGEVIHPPTPTPTGEGGRGAPRVVLVDFEIHGKRSVATNISSLNHVEVWPREDEKLRAFVGQLVKLGVSVVFSAQNWKVNLLHFALHKIGVVHCVEAADMAMLAACAGCQILREPDKLVEEPVIGDMGQLPVYGTVGSVEITERSSHFVLVRNREDSSHGPRTILLRGGSGEVLAEASRGLTQAIAVVKCALVHSQPLMQSPPQTEIGVVLGGGSVEAALASKLRAEYTTNGHNNGDRAAARVFAKALEGYVHQLATNSGLKAEAIARLFMTHQTGANPSLGIHGRAGILADVHQLKLWAPKQVVMAVLANAEQAASSVLRIDTFVTVPHAPPPAPSHPT